MKQSAFLKKTSLTLFAGAVILSAVMLSACPAGPTIDPDPVIPQSVITNVITNTIVNNVTNNITNSITFTNIFTNVIINNVTNTYTNTIVITNIVTNLIVQPISNAIVSADISGTDMILTLSISGAVEWIEVSLDGQLAAVLSNDYTNVSIDTSSFSAIYWDLSVTAYNPYTNSEPDSRLMNGTYIIKEATTAPTIDGSGSDPCWATVEWAPIDRLWMLSQPSPADFSGRSKFVWKGNVLYVLSEILDDVVNDAHTDFWYNNYWNDDCLEIFLDEDYSGGDHENNRNAFGYHCSISGDVVDVEAGSAITYNSNVSYVIQTIGTTNVWEFAVTVYDLNWGLPLLIAGKEIGLTMAYCDNDGNPNDNSERQSFMGMNIIDEVYKNVAYQNADYFGHAVLQ